MILKAILGLSGAILGPSWAILGPSWASLGPSWALLGLFWAILGPSWGHCWASWDPLGPSWGYLGPQWLYRMEYAFVLSICSSNLAALPGSMFHQLLHCSVEQACIDQYSSYQLGVLVICSSIGAYRNIVIDPESTCLVEWRLEDATCNPISQDIVHDQSK